MAPIAHCMVHPPDDLVPKALTNKGVNLGCDRMNRHTGYHEITRRARFNAKITVKWK